MDSPYAPFCPAPPEMDLDRQRERLQRLIDLLEAYDMVSVDAATIGLTAQLRDFSAANF